MYCLITRMREVRDDAYLKYFIEEISVGIVDVGA